MGFGALAQTPNPQSPIPNPQSPQFYLIKKKIIILVIKNLKIKLVIFFKQL